MLVRVPIKTLDPEVYQSELSQVKFSKNAEDLKTQDSDNLNIFVS